MTKPGANLAPFTEAEEAAMVVAALYDLGSLEADVTKVPARIGPDGDEAAPRPRRGRRPHTPARRPRRAQP